MTANKPTRPTLAAKVEKETGLKVYQLETALGLTSKTLQRWYKQNPLLVRFVIAGYRSEVLRQPVATD
jgi:hypothetical protein